MNSKPSGDSTRNLQFWPVETRLKEFKPQEKQRIMCFRLMREFYDANSQLLCKLKATRDNQGKLIEALFLLFLEMLQRMDKEIRTLDVYKRYRNGDAARSSKPWMNAYVEVVPATPTPEQAAVMATAHKHLIESARDIPANMIFWAPGTPVAEVRFWVLMDDEFYALSPVLETIIKESADQCAEYEKDPFKARRNLRGMNVSNAANMRPSAAVTLGSLDHQHWKKIASLPNLLDAISLYSQNGSLRTDPRAALPISNTDSPCNPFTAFNMFLPFQRPSATHTPVTDFRVLENYFEMSPMEPREVVRYNPETKQTESMSEQRSKITFKFPHPEFVMGPFPVEELTPEIVFKMYAPEYQFTHLVEQYWSLFNVSRSLGKILISSRKRRRLQPNNVVERDANNTDPEVQAAAQDNFVEEQFAADEVQDAEPELFDPMNVSVDELNNTMEAWRDACTQAGIGNATLASTEEIRTHRLETRDLRDASQMMNSVNEFAGEQDDKLAQLRKEAQEKWKQLSAETNRRAELYWQKRMANMPIDEDEEEFAKFKTFDRLREAFLARAHRAFSMEYATHFAGMIREEPDLQRADIIYASFLAKFVGAVLSIEAGFELMVFDKEMSMFAHKAMWLMQQFEQNEMVANAHLNMFKLYFGRFTCLSKTRTMKYNVIYEGEAMLSKSFLGELLRDQSIPGTCIEFQQKSAKSNYIDQHCDGLVMINHELPSAIMKSNNAKIDDTELCLLKDTLTKCESNYILYTETTGGMRSNRCVKTSQIQCHVYLTNHPVKSIDPAFFSRFDHFVATAVAANSDRANKTLNMLALAKGNAPKSIQESVVHFRAIAHLTQGLFWAVEQLIAMSIVRTPTLFCTNAMISEISTFLRINHMDEIHIRVRERILLLASSMVITMGIMYLYFTPTAKYLNKPFQVTQLIDINPLLVDTEEIAIFIIGLFSDTIENPYRNSVLKILTKLHRENQKRSFTAIDSFKHVIQSNTPAESGQSRFMHDHSAGRHVLDSVGGLPAAQMTADDIENDIEAMMINTAMQVEDEARARTTIQQSDLKRMEGRKYEYEYVQFNNSTTQLSEILSSMMAADEKQFPIKMSAAQIADQLVELSKKSRDMPTYGVPVGKKDSDVVLGLVQPVKLPTMMHAKYAMTSENKTYVHYSLIAMAAEMFDSECTSILERAIKDVQHRFTRPQKIIYGKTNTNTPFVFHTMRLAPNPNRTLELLNPYCKIKSAASILTESRRGCADDEDEDSSATYMMPNEYKVRLKSSIDLECMRRRLADLHVPVASVSMLESQSVHERDKKIMDYVIHVTSSDPRSKKLWFTYPDTIIRDLHDQIRAAEEAQNDLPEPDVEAEEEDEVNRLFAGM